MKGKIYFTTIIILLSSLSFFAQTPTVLTLKATGVSSSSASNPNTFIYATLQGVVNANGADCSVSFEYGNTTSYGNTVAVGTVTGSTDVAVSSSVTLNYTFTNYEQHREINYRLVVTNANGTFYGRNYIALPFDATRKIKICTSCSDSPTWATYEVRNSNSNIDVMVYFTDGIHSGSTLTLTSYQTELIMYSVEKNRITTFAYQTNTFKQIVANNQFCSETQTPEKNILIYTLGRFYGSYSQLYKIENRNANPATVSVQIYADTYTQTIPAMSAAYVATGGLWDMQIAYNGEPFAIASYSLFEYEESNWLDITAISSTSTTATFDLYNRDDVAHTYVLRNAAGTEHSYSVPAHQSYLVTLPNEVWDVLISVYDINAEEWNSGGAESIRVGETFGDPVYAINGKLKIATATPGSALTPSVSSASIASSTSLTLNGAIANSAFSSADVDYHFIYGTDPNNLNLSSATQSGTVPASGSLNVSATVTGLTAETMYYFKLVAATTQSSAKKIFLSTAIPTANLKLHLRSDLAVTSASSAVSNWGDVSGFDNDASQSTSANQPTLVSNSMNGNPVIRFNGTNSKLTLPTSSTLGIQSNPYEMFVVAKSSSSDVQFLISGNANENFEYHLNGVGARIIPLQTSPGTYLDLGSTGTYTDGNAHIFSARASSSGGAVRVDGNDGGTTSTNILSSNSGALQLGARSDGNYYFNGDIAEVILYNTNLSTSDRSTVEHYLANRYGITSSALPVELTSFTASAADGKVLLNWQTATKVNNYGFSVERRVKSEERASTALGMTWQKIGFVQGHGNSNSPKSYSFTDNLALAHNLNLLQYRLKQIDFDGKYEYSNVVEVKVEMPTQFSLAQNYPNPFNPETTIKYQLPVSGHVTLKVFDMLGKEVATLVDEYKQAGTHNSQFSILNSQLASGTYLYQLKAGGFVLTKKFLLMK